MSAAAHFDLPCFRARSEPQARERARYRAEAFPLATALYVAACEGKDSRLDRSDGCVSELRLADMRSPAEAAAGVPPRWEVFVYSDLPGMRGNTGWWGTRLFDAIAALAVATVWDGDGEP
jgi:hypothetical protein